ncbi:hypothetical protein THAOC_01268 [Thalassiosira oceanica]|uniref:Uncharacterized protein n=1 Tax=Thalassiosira oceanica TaxID=159749 RepID=K0TN85_THAOC|nr:hypothetical protein THAOC_01268 [Thalassiosira oceanica]|eukprot:EJK76941.1 hypothetical protein THAOC_01268 [Thalassiosira oceanica]
MSSSSSLSYNVETASHSDSSVDGDHSWALVLRNPDNTGGANQEVSATHQVPANGLALVPHVPPPAPAPQQPCPRARLPQVIATISAGFERGDYLVREERGANIYFDFFEEAYNFASQKGFSRMSPPEESDYMEMIRSAYNSIPGGPRFNRGRLLIVMKKRLVPVRIEDDSEPDGLVAGRELEEGREGDGTASSQSEGEGASPNGTVVLSWEEGGESSGYSYADSWEQ